MYDCAGDEGVADDEGDEEGGEDDESEIQSVAGNKSEPVDSVFAAALSVWWEAPAYIPVSSARGDTEVPFCTPAARVGP